MGSSNGQIRKLTSGLVMHTNELYHKSYPGEPTKNLMPIAESNTDFSARLGGVTHAFYRVYKDKDPHQQGMFKSLATGSIGYDDVVYKYSWTGASYLMGLHTFSGSDYNSLYLDIGSEYTLSCEVFVSKTHYRADKAMWPVISIKATDQAKSYGYYDFSKKGTWQVINILVKPSLKSTTTATSGTSSSAGSGGSAGTAGTSGIVQTSLHHTVYFWPHEGTTSASQKNGGYILYKNPQLEKNKKVYEGKTHRTQFSRGSRNASNSLRDLSGSKNSLSVIQSEFDDNALPLFSNGGYQNLGLTATESGYSSTFNVGSTSKKSYEFWVNLNSIDQGISTLLYSDLSRGANFTNKENISRKQHVFVSQGRVHCNLYNEFGLSNNCFTQDECVPASTTTHIIVSVDMSLSTNKVKIYINGYNRPVQNVFSLQPPRDLSATTYPIIIEGEPQLGGQAPSFLTANTNINYKVSSYNEDGESASTNNRKVFITSPRVGVLLNWLNVADAKSFYVYKSVNVLNEFSNVSLLARVPNPFFGGEANEMISFKDDGSAALSSGFPKSSSAYSKYTLKNTTFYDGTDLKLSIGGYPTASATSEKTYSEGKIYKVSVYKKALSPSDALDSYIQGYRDFNLTNNTADYNFSVSAGTSTGGLGGY